MWKRSWALAMGATPTLSGCVCFPGYCGDETTVPWDGKFSNGVPWDGGGAADCTGLCPTDAGYPYGYCFSPDAGLLTCRVVCAGRAPPGLLGLSPLGETAGSWLAASAEFEAAAVHAFWQLADELEAHGLCGERAREAAYDEVRHARATTKLALSLGHLPSAPRIARLTEPRSLEDLAIDNGFEGCGRELFGAVLNAWQSEHATDERVRALMRDITPDEQQHARFSLELAEALMPKLSVAGRRRVREAQERALATLGAENVPESVRRQLGLMDADQAKRTMQHLLDRERV